jgi:hypothetical protein
MYSQICRSAALYRPYFGTLRILCSASTLLFPRKAPHRTERTAHLPNLNPVAQHSFPPRSEFAACPSPGSLASHVAARLGLSRNPRHSFPPRSEFAACPSPGGLASHVAARLGLSRNPRHSFPPRSEFAACPSPGGLASHAAARLGLSHSPRTIMPPAAGRKFSASAYAQKSAAGNKFQLRQYAYHASADAARIPCRN